jgi:hypothetical protein
MTLTAGGAGAAEWNSTIGPSIADLRIVNEFATKSSLPQALD